MRATRARTLAVLWACCLPALLAPTVGRAGEPAVATAPAPSAQRTAGTDERVYAGALELVREKRYDEALPVLVSLARATPSTHVLGLLVAVVASARHDPVAATRLRAEADAAPGDPLLQFMAGVATHYCGHVAARDQAEKRRYYELALPYLQRTLPAYDHVVRVWIYIAVSHYRLGHQQEAEEAIAEAAKRNAAGDEADVYYCRAEIMHRIDPAAAVADIDRYLAIMKANVAHGAFTDQGKEARLRDMRDLLRRAADGAPVPDAAELFDPVLVGDRDRDRPLPMPWNDPTHPAMLVLYLLLVFALGRWWWVRRRQRAASGGGSTR